MKQGGFTAFKIKVGVDKPLVDAERTRRVCRRRARPADLRRRQHRWSTDEAVIRAPSPAAG
jgi:L-alanine-DL-glutamate epimerase-like enolase superfamily enzyme